jgi:hypothetical protein
MESRLVQARSYVTGKPHLVQTLWVILSHYAICTYGESPFLAHGNVHGGQRVLK